MNCNNVCGILELSFNYAVEALKSQCLEFVAHNSEAVLNGDGFLTLSRDSFEAILQVNRMVSGPSTLFNSCVKWAKHQLKNEQYVGTPDDLQIRETLGDFLYEIPFPTISAIEFAKVVGESGVLTSDEKSALYYYFASGEGKNKLKFNTVNKRERLVNLTTKITKGLWPHSKCSSCGSLKKSPFEISLRTNKDILLTGIGLYKGHDGSDFPADIKVTLEKVSLFHRDITLKTKRKVSYTESSTTFKVAFDEPVSIVQGKLYKMSALACETIGYFGELCKEVVVEDVTFTVASISSPNPSDTSYGCCLCGTISNKPKCSKCRGFGNNSVLLTYGQIPHLYFIPV